MDPANMGGVRPGDQPASEDPEEMHTPAESKPVVEMHWNICNYLPVPTQQYFQVLVAEYIFKTYEFRSGYRAPSSQYSQGVTPQKARLKRADPTVEDDETFFARNLVKTHLAPKLYKIVPEIQQTLSGDHSAVTHQSSDFPLLPGSHLNLNNPALEFVKSVCHVLHLDRQVHEEVTLLRKNLFKLLDIDDCSKAAAFQNPCATLILPDVVCTECNYSRDMDLCRDPDLVGNDEAPGSWACPECNAAYDKRAVERLLLDHWERRVMAFQLQDLVCQKCREVKGDNLNLYCACTGRFTLLHQRANLIAKQKTLLRIAEFHEMPLLAAVVSSLP
eukprot:Colp12_sorted_trinity150504_noHs@22435